MHEQVGAADLELATGHTGARGAIMDRRGGGEVPL